MIMADIRKKTEKNKEAKGSRALYILLSVIAALALWIYVTYVDNPDRETAVSNIPVQFVGDEILLDNNLMVTGVNVNKINVRFGGKWNVLSNLAESKIAAEVDLSQIVSRYSANAGTYMLGYDLKFDETLTANGLSNKNVLSASHNYITVTVEKTVTLNVPVNGVFDGDVAEGYSAQPLEYSTDSITVSGPQAIVSQVDCAWVTLKRDNVNRSITEILDIELRDKDDNVIDASSLILSQDTVTVNLRVFMVKDVALTVKLIDGQTADDSNTRVEIDPPSITLSGDPAVLSELNQIVLDTIDLTEFATTYNQTYIIPLPNNVNNLKGATTANVEVEIIGRSTKRLSTTNLEVANNTDGYEAIIITQSLDVLLRGDEGRLQFIDPEDVRIIADLTELGNTTGTFSVTGKVVVSGVSKIDAIGDYNITVQIAKVTAPPIVEPDVPAFN